MFNVVWASAKIMEKKTQHFDKTFDKYMKVLL